MVMQAKTIWSIGALLQWTSDFFAGHQIEEPRLSAELLLSHVLNCSRMELYTQFEKVPGPAEIQKFRELVKKRREHTPVAYLIGKSWFFSMEFAVSQDVLIPRPDTETLVETAIRAVRLATTWEKPEILELGVGSGCISIALAKHLTEARVVATDISQPALAMAEVNARRVGVLDRVRLVRGDLYEALDAMPVRPRFHLIVSNPPYIQTGQIAALMPEVKDHEPRLALDGGETGLTFYHRIVAGAPEYLLPTGMLLVETAFDQAAGVAEIMNASGKFSEPRIVRDAAGHQRCVLTTLR
jgi:release factor glutamine methyltransferase